MGARMPTAKSNPTIGIAIGAMGFLALAGALVLFLAVGLALPAAAAESVDVVFVLDNSGSMREHDPAFLTREAVFDFVEALAEQAREQAFEARVAVVLFDEHVVLALPLSPLASTEAQGGPSADSARAILAPALEALDYSGQRTRSADGVERALYTLRHAEARGARQAIVFLTDGKLDTGDAARDREASAWLRTELAAEARELGIQIFGLAFTDSADYQLLQSVAHQTDADYYRALEASELGDVAGRILARLTNDAPSLATATDGLRPGPRPDAVGGTSDPLPSVAAASADASIHAGDAARAPLDEPTGSRPIGHLAWLPLAILLIAGGVWGARRRIRARAGAEPGGQDPSKAPAAAQLLDVGGVLGETGRAIPLFPGRNRIGRDAHNEIVIRDDAVSSEHAIIELDGGRYWLEDLRSTNGTKHRDVRLAPGQRIALKGGDHVRFADVDLLFVAAGHVPVGSTVVLPSTITPPSHWRSAARPARTGSDAEPAREPAGPAFEIPSGELFRECLDYHLARVEELSPAFARFVARAFHDEMRAALCVAAGELVRTANREDRIAERAYTHDHIRYVVCGAPGGMDAAAKSYQSTHGGFSRFLTEQIESDSFRADHCETLAVLSFGRAAGSPWVTLSIVADEGLDPQIDLLSFELLSESERQTAATDATHEVSRSGLR